MKAGGYYGSAFHGSRGATQGDTLYPIIFNDVVDMVVWNWVAVMVESVDRRSGSGKEGRHQNSLFYADDGMVVSLDLRCLQGAFSTIVGMFGRLVLNTNLERQLEWSPSCSRRWEHSRRRCKVDG